MTQHHRCHMLSNPSGGVACQVRSLVPKQTFGCQGMVQGGMHWDDS